VSCRRLSQVSWWSYWIRSISARLIALLVVPGLVVTGLLVVRLDETLSRRDRTEQASRLANELAATRRLRALVDVSRGPMTTVVLVNQLGVGFDAAQKVLDVDLNGQLAQVERLINTGLERLRSVSTDNSTVNDLEDRLAQYRALATAEDTTATDVTEAADSLDDLLNTWSLRLDQNLSSTIVAGVGNRDEATRLQARLADLSIVANITGVVGQLTSDIVIALGYPNDAGDSVLLSIAATAQVEDDLRGALAQRATDSVEPATQAWLERRGDALRELGLGAESPSGLDQFARGVLAHDVATAGIEWQLAASPRFYAETMRLSDTAAAISDAQRYQAQRMGSMALAIGGVTLGWALFVVGSMVRPIRRLTARAERLRDGDVTVADTTTGTGASELRSLQATFDQLTSNMQVVARQAEALGSGRLDDPVLNDQLPGAFGSALRQSVDRASTLTERLADQARLDPMTGLANRIAAMDRLAEAIDRGARLGSNVGVLLVDIDQLKVVNDVLGQRTGDAVVCAVAEQLVDVSRSGETVARYEGDQFVVIAEGFAHADDVVSLGARLVAAGITPIEPIDVGPQRRTATSVSVGVAVADADSTAEQLLAHVGLAVTEAKANGGAKVQFFDSAMQAAAIERSDIERGLRAALDQGELELFIQPIVAATDGRLVGAEALIRWQRPGFGLVPPIRFIPVAESSWLIVEIGRFVLDEAARLTRSWLDRGWRVPLSVNIAGRHLAEGDLIADVHTVLARYGTPADVLTVELTESQLVSDLEAGANLLAELRRIGVRVALDDFGTGYSSINYLRQLPLDVMKIDQSYVRELPHSEQALSIVRSLSSLAAGLGLNVVAEGVETAEQAAALAELGCDRLQGYLFARPMPVSEFEAQLAAASHPTEPVVEA
jgi:diguanylate cyclase (GGDEF)-like protein